MRKKVLILGIALLFIGIIFELFSGATLPGDITIPLIYGSNQILWLFVALVGLIVSIVGLILRKK
ncbi:MAG: hypothetical protein NT139_00630 [Candidatus Woesearchaeota archaeon]|nr:hypothetical protein [Candidatus Woesearchaeota archaeon]